VCDRVKSSLSENCIKSILSVENSKDKGWLPVKELTESVDRFIAAKGDSVRPKAFAIGQTPLKIFKPNAVGGGEQEEAAPHTPKFAGSTSSPGTFKGGGTPLRQIVCYDCGKTGHIAKYCPTPTESGKTPKASAKRVAVMKPSSVIQSGDRGGSETHPVSTSFIKRTHKVDHSTNTELEPGEQHSTVSVGVNTGEHGDNYPREEPVNKVSVCCPSTQLSSLTYVDVVVKSDESDAGFVVKALSDTGAQISMLDAELLGTQKVNSLGKIKLQPFCGESIEADWVKLSVAPVTDQCSEDACVTIDCAIVPKLNENMILTADVISRLLQCERIKQNDEVACDVVKNDDDGDEDVVCIDDSMQL